MKRELSFSTRSEVLNVNKTTETIIGAAIEVHRHLGQVCLNQLMKSVCVKSLRCGKFPSNAN